MKPGSLVVRPWKRIDIFIGTPITFAEWVSSPSGGNLNNEKINQLLLRNEEEKMSQMKEIFRNLTDQIIETLRLNGAP